MKAPQSVPLAVLLLVLAAVAAVPAAAQETILQNDGYVSGPPAFLNGFAATSMAGSSLMPVGTPPWRVNRVRFFFGGAASTETITLHIYEDAGGTLAPGGELFVANYQITGSDTMQEIDLTANNVQVTGQFRVALEFHHNGVPSIARDTDGTIQPMRNFVFSSPDWYDAITFMVPGDWIIRAGVQEVGAGGGYFTVAPCRVVDTRGGAPIGGPALVGQQARTLAIAGNCGIPATATAVSVNLAGTQPTAGGNVRLYPTGQAVPTVSSINYAAGQTRGNNAIVQLDGNGAMDAFVGQPAGTTVDLILDVNGYFE